MSTPQEFQRVNAELEALKASVADAKAEALREAADRAFADRSIQGLQRVLIGNWLRNEATR